MRHGLLILAIISNVQTIDNVLGDGADECIRDCHYDGVDEDTEVSPIVELGLVLLVSVLGTLHQHQGQEDRSNRDSHQKYNNQDYLSIDEAPLLFEDNFFSFTLLLVKNILSISLLELDRSFNLFLSLFESPSVTEGSMLSLPAFQVECRPQCDEYDVAVVNRVVCLDVVALEPSLVFSLVFEPKVDLD